MKLRRLVTEKTERSALRGEHTGLEGFLDVKPFAKLMSQFDLGMVYKQEYWRGSHVKNSFLSSPHIGPYKDEAMPAINCLF